MRLRLRTLHTACCLFFMLRGGSPAAPDVPHQEVLILARFESPSSARTIREMQQELDVILASVGVKVDWVIGADQVEIPSALRPVTATFRGRCEANKAVPVRVQYGTLGRTLITDGEIRPYVELECDQIVALIQTAIWGKDPERSASLLGRAMARVLAHELYHVLARTRLHGKNGIARALLSAEQLVGKRLDFGRQDANRIQSSVCRQSVTFAVVSHSGPRRR
jgi:hypothetical protein